MRNKLFFLFILIAACSKNSSHHTIAVPDLIQAEKTRANISGRILLYDGENIAATDNSGITVSIDNSTVTTQTGADGKWTLDSIPKGTYDISYSKPGYGTGKIMGIFHAATNHATTLIARSESMNIVSSIDISNIKTASFSSASWLVNAINLGLIRNGLFIEPIFNNPTSKNKPVRLFFSDKNVVSASNYLVTEKIFTSGKDEVKETLTFDLKWFESKGFKLGQPVYIKAYGDGYKDDTYENANNGLPVYPSLASSGSPTISVVIPEK
jgi:hypothetical protein